MSYSDWSNAFYVAPPIAAALVGLDVVSVLMFAVAWIGLAFGSYMGHVQDTRFWWKVDVFTMYAAILSIGVGVTAQVWSLDWWALLPIVLFIFWMGFRNDDMKWSVGLFVFFSLTLLLLTTGWPALIVALLFGIAVYYRLKVSDDEHDVAHGHWHTISAIAGTLAVYLIGTIT